MITAVIECRAALLPSSQRPVAVGLWTDTADPGHEDPGGGRGSVFDNRADRRNSHQNWCDARGGY